LYRGFWYSRTPANISSGISSVNRWNATSKDRTPSSTSLDPLEHVSFPLVYRITSTDISDAVARCNRIERFGDQSLVIGVFNSSSYAWGGTSR
jgi:hypothetical protein